MSGKCLSSQQNIPQVPEIAEWKGFMHLVCESIKTDKSAVKPLPFINSPPNANTLYTAFKYASEDNLQQSSKICLVTFDQPLYVKVREIVGLMSDDTLFRTIVLRLGGFHMPMSYMGCIGHTMAESGLKDVLCLVFAPNSVDKMLTGHVYTRAVRGHLLVQGVLTRIILDGVGISSEEQEAITNILCNMEELTPEKVRENSHLTSLQKKLKNELHRIKGNGPTAALRVQYFNMVSLMKKFITAERCDDWNGHLLCAQQMIPFFHASGHFQYAKCTHLYVQDMLALATRHPDVIEKFVEKGHFTINSSPCAGVWSDMVIEQTVMRSGRKRSQLSCISQMGGWITCSCCHMFVYRGIWLNVFSSGEQHIDFRVSRRKRDEQYRFKIYEWFVNHPPFPELPSLMSLSTGAIGNSKTNSYQALEIGTRMMKSLIGSNFGDIKQ
ncbi:hypothetical protein AVEN_115503-1 [Araneus ventricosus]|uniref:Uncharacterized protein n=1 Tax=Araneus ventricosus TaxID=182803 RepID=A0A4Y2XBT1_ARAVE|nr:hypothetical protein AVEN_115503-1 [Araneus ventricosus]